MAETALGLCLCMVSGFHQRRSVRHQYERLNVYIKERIMIELITTMNPDGQPDVLKVINILVDKTGNEYELWVDGEDFAIARSGYRDVPIRLDLLNLAAYCWQNQLSYILDEEPGTETMFRTLDEIVHDLQDEENIYTSRIVNMENQKVYIYLKELKMFTDEDGDVLLDIEDMPQRQEEGWFLEPFISDSLITGCDKKLMTERVTWLREELLQMDTFQFALELDLPLNLYAPFENGTFHSPLVFNRITEKLPWIDTNWLAGK